MLPVIYYMTYIFIFYKKKLYVQDFSMYFYSLENLSLNKKKSIHIYN